MSLKTILEDASTRTAVIGDCVQLIDSEVKAKGGLSGVAVQGAYGIVKAIKPGIIREAVDRLLDPFVERLAPFFDEWKASASSDRLEDYLSQRKTTVANALLGVTDDRAAKADNQTLKKAYNKLRPKAVGYVETAVPGIARIMQSHAPSD